MLKTFVALFLVGMCCATPRIILKTLTGANGLCGWDPAQFCPKRLTG